MTTRGGKATAALTPSPVDAWGEEPEKAEHLLPTGRVMTLRRAPSLRRLIREGVIPSALIGFKISEPDDDGNRSMTYDEKLLEEQKAAIVCAMVVDPNVVMEPLDGAVTYDRLADSEVEYIVAHAREGVAGTARFLVDVGGDPDGAGGEVVGEVAE